MNEMSHFLASYAGPVLFLAIFAEQLGVPLPAAPLLLAAGALAAEGALDLPALIALTVVACVLADLCWFYAGRKTGHGLLRFVCRLLRCDASYPARTERFFARHGMSAVAMAKFIPGLGLFVSPLAGASGFTARKFLWIDTLGSLLYVSFYLELGFLFNNQVAGLLALLERFSMGVVAIAFAFGIFLLICKHLHKHKTAAA